MNSDMFFNKVVIVNDDAKISLLKKIDKLVNMKIITLSELKKKYVFDYDYRAIYYVSSKYHCIPSIASKYIDNIYYINDGYKSSKIEFLSKLKQELEERGLLIRNKLFVNFLKDKDIILYNLRDVSLFYKNIIDELKKYNNVSLYYEHNDNSLKRIYCANNNEEEVAFVCSYICKLLKEGISINKIKLANVSDDYLFVVKKMFKMFNIPININGNESIKSTEIVRKFKELYDGDIASVLSKVYEFISDDVGYKIYKDIVSVVNKYSGCNYLDIKELLFDDIDKIKISSCIYDNAVSVIDFKDYLIDVDDYVFLINFNEGVIPICYKDEDYLSDREKMGLGIDTSFMLNKNSNKEVQDIVLRLKHLIVSYSMYNLSGRLYVSTAYDSDIFIEDKIDILFNNSSSYNKIRLLKEMDVNNKYGIVSKDLLVLSNHYKNYKYLSYDNKFKGINNEKLRRYMNDSLTLSYTGMDSYYHCAFRYYLDYILKINKYEDSFDTVLGNIFHKILSMYFKDNIDISSIYDSLIKDINYNFSASEMFFLDNLKEELLFVIKTIKEQMEYTCLKKLLCEKEIIINLSSDGKIKFKGFVDKILYDYFDGKMITVIIDYKTGNPNVNLNNVIYGLDMQLPVYVYLIKNEIKDVVIGGFYLQKILSNSHDVLDKKVKLRWQGYTNSDIDVLEKVDLSYNNSQIIKSLRTKKDGFYSYSKVISNDEINMLYDIVSKKIMECSSNIMNGNFVINPKEINSNLVGCSYCKYHDICYMSFKDVVTLEDKGNIF